MSNSSVNLPPEVRDTLIQFEGQYLTAMQTRPPSWLDPMFVETARLGADVGGSQSDDPHGHVRRRVGDELGEGWSSATSLRDSTISKSIGPTGRDLSIPRTMQISS